MNGEKVRRMETDIKKLGTIPSTIKKMDGYSEFRIFTYDEMKTVMEYFSGCIV